MDRNFCDVRNQSGGTKKERGTRWARGKDKNPTLCCMFRDEERIIWIDKSPWKSLSEQSDRKATQEFKNSHYLVK